mmetsp:Transcript_22720/g.44582  ORF Transcript_22720/g.44582 Transcript_22720/m.44582 type:complete len:97 (-) Transcript_22720:285-575(-)
MDFIFHFLFTNEHSPSSPQTHVREASLDSLAVSHGADDRTMASDVDSVGMPFEEDATVATIGEAFVDVLHEVVAEVCGSVVKERLHDLLHLTVWGR